MFGTRWSNEIIPGITWDRFIRDMKEKWRYKYGTPEVRDALMRAQARYYGALADVGIPAEAYLRRMTADVGIPSEAFLRIMQAGVGIPSEAFYRTASGYNILETTRQSQIHPELYGELIKELLPLLRGLYELRMSQAIPSP